jgi:hypothetical protein
MNIKLTDNDREDLVDYIKDHITHFNAVPMDFETAEGNIISYEDVWQVASDENLLNLIN